MFLAGVPLLLSCGVVGFVYYIKSYKWKKNQTKFNTEFYYNQSIVQKKMQVLGQIYQCRIESNNQLNEEQ